MRSLHFLIDLILMVDSFSNRNEYLESSRRVKGGRCVRLSPHSRFQGLLYLQTRRGRVLTQVEGEVDLVGVLDGLKHRLRLPPRLVLIVVEVGEVGRRVCLGPRAVTHLARLLGAGSTRLHTELGRTLLAAGVGGLYEDTEGRILEARDASLGTEET
jgi:hypothetical protein